MELGTKFVAEISIFLFSGCHQLEWFEVNDRNTEDELKKKTYIQWREKETGRGGFFPAFHVTSSDQRHFCFLGERDPFYNHTLYTQQIIKSLRSDHRFPFM
ncbi:uncharacterized protein ACNLHF_011057 [Anomaloglossus baeobatrachus]